MGKTVTNIASAALMVVGTIYGGPVGYALIAAGIATQAAGAMIYKDKMPSMNYRDQSERKQMLRSSTAPETIIVGKTVCSGLLFSQKKSAVSKMKMSDYSWRWHSRLTRLITSVEFG